MGKNPGGIIGLALIGGGALLFLDNLGLLPFSAAALVWPLVFIGYGAAWLYSSNSPTGMVWGGTAIAAGVLLLLGKLNILPVRGATLWPLALIGAGATLLVGRLRWPVSAGRLAFGSNSDATASFDRVQEVAIFSGVKRKVDSIGFEGGQLSCVFGGIEIDLRRAGISAPGREVVIEANAVFGGIELRVPETWRVSLQGHAIFGAYEDKTLPPRPEPGIDIPVLIIRGGTAFGAVVVQN